MVSEQLLVLPITYYEEQLPPEKTVLTSDPTQEAQKRKWDQVGIKLPSLDQQSDWATGYGVGGLNICEYALVHFISFNLI